MKTSVAYGCVASPILPALLAGSLIASGFFASSVVTSSPALAASPAYCALYAREYATSRIGAPVTSEDASAVQRVEDQAYYRCLNQDDAPQFPTTSAYFGQPLDDIAGEGTGEGGPFQALEIHPKAKPATTAAKVRASAGGAEGTQVADLATPRASVSTWANHGAPGTAQWVSWCRGHYKSFDEATGHVLTLSGVKKACP